MSLSSLIQFIFTTFCLARSTALADIESAAYDASNIIIRDICVIGGGSSGTYSAIRLHDEGKSVVIIEAKDRLGGHTQTYTDPSSNATVDYGVVVWHNTSLVKSYFTRFNIPLVDVPNTPLPTEHVDFRTGKVVTGYAPSDPTAALTEYGAQLAKYPYLDDGFSLPDPVPADLLLPFGDFVKKYAIGNAVNICYNYAQGFGDLLSHTTLYVFKVCGLTILQGGFLTSANQDNSELYEKAQAELSQDVLLESRVIAMDRSSSGVKVLVQTPSGVKLILANKIIIAIPPK